MSYKWKEVKLGDVCKIRRGSSPRPIVNYMSAEGMPWVKISDATETNSRYINKTKEFIKHEGVKSSVVVKQGDLILSNSGTAGLPKFMGITACVHDGWQVLTELGGIEKGFLYYTLLNIRAKLLHNAYDSTMKNLTLDMVRNAEIRLPPLRTQEIISSTLSDIDNKLELNHQINQTLEQMTQAFFKSWFVDFDPVKAKITALDAGGSEEDALLAAMQAISGKAPEDLTRFQAEKPEQYAKLHATAELFPSTMQHSELGEIPEGWKVGTLADLADLNKNSWSKRTIPPEVEYVDLANTKNGTVESTTMYTSDDAPSRARRVLSDGDTIIGTVRPGNRSFAFIKMPPTALTGSTGFAILSPKRVELAEFIYIAATSDDSISHLAHLADGGAYPAVRPEVVVNMRCILPCSRLLVSLNKSSYI